MKDEKSVPLLILFSYAALTFGCLITLVWPKFELEHGDPVAASEVLPESVLLGREIYIQEGCWYCHSQNVRAPEAHNGFIRNAGDIGAETTVKDNARFSPVLWGTSRQGPDLSRVGGRSFGREWHRLHLMNPRAVDPMSFMPAYSYLGEQKIEALVSYLMSLK